MGSGFTVLDYLVMKYPTPLVSVLFGRSFLLPVQFLFNFCNYFILVQLYCFQDIALTTEVVFVWVGVNEKEQVKNIICDEFACIYLRSRAFACLRLRVLFAIDRVRVHARVCTYIGKVWAWHYLH